MQADSAASVKLELLLEKLDANEADTERAAARARSGGGKSAPAPPPVKAVVFSQFTSMLALVADALKLRGIPFVRIDGSVSAARRNKVSVASRRPPHERLLACTPRCSYRGILHLASCKSLRLLPSLSRRWPARLGVT